MQLNPFSFQVVTLQNVEELQRGANLRTSLYFPVLNYEPYNAEFI